MKIYHLEHEALEQFDMASLNVDSRDLHVTPRRGDRGETVLVYEVTDDKGQNARRISREEADEIIAGSEWADEPPTSVRRL